MIKSRRIIFVNPQVLPNILEPCNRSRRALCQQKAGGPYVEHDSKIHKVYFKRIIFFVSTKEPDCNRYRYTPLGKLFALKFTSK